MVDEQPRFPRLIERFDHFDPEFESNFFAVAHELRERCPVVHTDAHHGYWVFTRFEDVQNGFGDDALFTTAPTVTIPINPGAVPMIPLQCEGGIHRDFRRVLDPYFRVAAVVKYEEDIRAITTDLIDSFIEQGRCEFIDDFARKLAGRVIFRVLLGLPEEQVDEAFRLTLAIMHDLDKPEAPQIHASFMELVAGMLEQRRAEPPRGDVVDALLAGTVDGRPIAEDEKQRVVVMLIAAGLDTTAHSFGNILVTLTQHPELRKMLEDDPSLIPNAVEELLRWVPPASGLVRTAARDVAVGGQQVSAGEQILLLVSAANHDPAEYETPDEIRFDRPQMRHLSFGYGPHYCIGVHLARLELRVALQELLTRVKDVAIVDAEIEYDSGTSRGPVRLDIAFTAGTRSGMTELA